LTTYAIRWPVHSSAAARRSTAACGVRKVSKISVRSPRSTADVPTTTPEAAALAKELGVPVTNENRKAVKGADIVLLGVKPQVIAEVLKEIAPEITENTLIISVAASVPTNYLEQHLRENVPVIRAMPNTPAAVGCGMTGICRGARAEAEHLEIARAMFEAVGRTVVVDEKNRTPLRGSRQADRPLPTSSSNHLLKLA